MSDLMVNVAKCLHFLALHHDNQNSWHRQEWRNYVIVNVCIGNRIILISVLFDGSHNPSNSTDASKFEW